MKPIKSVPIEIPVGRITAITPSPRAAGRFDLIVDGEPVARLSIDGIERLGLHGGREITESLAVAIGAEAEISRAYDRAMAMLAGRGRASGELRRLLVQKGETPVAVDQAVQRLGTSGFVDDAAFARQFARWKAVTVGLSRRRIERELAQRGIDRDTASMAISEVFAEEGVDDMASIGRAAERKLRTMATVAPDARRRRLYGFLARRGYDSQDIGAVVRRLATGRPEEAVNGFPEVSD